MEAISLSGGSTGMAGLPLLLQQVLRKFATGDKNEASAT